MGGIGRLFAALALVSTVTLVAPARAQDEKLADLLHLVLDQTSTADVAALGTIVQADIGEGDVVKLGILIRSISGVPPSVLESNCDCGLVTGDAAPGPLFDLIPATIPYAVLGTPSENRDPGQPLIHLASLPEVAFVSAAEIREPTNDIGTNNTGTFDANNAPIFLGSNGQILHQTGVNGTGVVVGVVDTGIDWRHRDFRDGAGCTRILSLWDQTDVIGQCSAPAPDLQCQPGAGGNAFCAGLPVCTMAPPNQVIPCTLGAVGTALCKFATLNVNSTCAAAAGATCQGGVCTAPPPAQGTRCTPGAGGNAFCTGLAAGSTCAATPGRLPPGFTFGAEWTQADINFGLGGGCGGVGPAGVAPREIDTVGHGTHVAGTAAGNGSASGGASPFPFEGMAPVSGLVIVKTTFSNKDIAEAVRYVFARAGAMPAVVNLSLGGHGGPHDGTANFDTQLSQLTGAGRLIVASAGNEADESMHADNRTSPVALNATQTTTFNVPAVANQNCGPPPCETWMNIWHHNGDRYSVTVTGPGGAPTLTVAAGASGKVTVGSTTIEIVNARGDLAPAGGGGTGIQIGLIGQLPTGIKAGNWTIQLMRTANNTNGIAGDGIWDAWIYFGGGLNGVAFVPTGNGADGQPTNARKIGEPGTAKRVITIASHNTKNTPKVTRETLGAISGFSSPGPTRDGRLKPELSAPGRRIASSCSINGPHRCSDTAAVCDATAAMDPCQPTGNCV